MSPNVTLYAALALYAAGTLLALASLFGGKRLQTPALWVMLAGFVSHTVWIGSICVRTHHPPLTNLPETAAFLSWTIFVVELVLLFKYRVHAASFFVYPLVLMLLTIAAVVHEPFALIDPKNQSKLFTTHILLSTIGVAALLIGLAFNALAWMQDRSLKSKQRGALWEWIPSLNVCRTLSYRALAVGFSIYTLGLLTGILWSYRTTAELVDLRVKQVGAIVAWVLFATLLQSYISGVYRGKRTMVISACALVAVLVAILGIRHA